MSKGSRPEDTPPVVHVCTPGGADPQADLAPGPRRRRAGALGASPWERARAPVVLHVPHSSTAVPPTIPPLLLSPDELRRELLAMTDRYADRLFHLSRPLATQVVFPVSRLVVDPERFVDDDQEPMAARGMGVVYTRTSAGRRLRRDPTEPERRELIARYYEPHHSRLERAVEIALTTHGR